MHKRVQYSESIEARVQIIEERARWAVSLTPPKCATGASASKLSFPDEKQIVLTHRYRRLGPKHSAMVLLPDALTMQRFDARPASTVKPICPPAELAAAIDPGGVLKSR